MKNVKSIFASICCIFLLIGNLYSQDVGLTPDELSRMFTPNNIGTEFYLSLPPIKLKKPEVTFDLYGVELYIYSPVEADVEIKVISSQYQLPNGILKVKVNPFQPAIIPQSQLPFQFVAPYADIGETPDYPRENEYFGGRAVYVKSTAPIAVYVWFKNRQYNEGYVAIPKSNTSTEYVIGSSTDLGTASVEGIPMPSFITIIGQSSVPTFVTANIGGRLGTNSNVPPVTGTTSVQLGEGDVSFIVSKSGGELTGTKLTGNRPFAVLTGNLCAYMPEAGDCNTAIEMAIPTRAWGKNYYIPKMPHSNTGYRQKQTITRVFSKEENTAINVNGVQQGVLGTNGAQGWNPGSWQELPIDRAAANNHKGYLISSDKPITVTGYGTSRQDDNNPGNTNPFQLQFVPVEQFQTLQMVGKINSVYYPYLAVIVTELNSDESFPDLEYAVLNQNTKKLGWLPVSTIQRSITEKQVFDIPTDGKKYGSMNLNLDAQVTAFRSSKPFAVYIVAYNSQGAAGYAGSMGLKDLTRANDTRVPRVWITDSSCGYRTVKVSVSDQGPNNVQSPIQEPFLNPTFSYNYAITNSSTLGASDPKNGTYTIEVIDMWKDAEAVFTVSDVVGNDTFITFKYIAPDITPLTDIKDLSPNPVIFDKGIAFDTIVKLSNKTVKPFLIQELELQNKNPNFEVLPGQFPRTLQPGEVYDVKIRVHALEDGFHQDSLGYEICGTKYYFSLLQVRIGTPNLKVGNVAFTPIDAAFGSIQVSKSGTVDFEMRNVGTGIVKIDKNSFTLPTQPEFEVYLKNSLGTPQTLDQYFVSPPIRSLRPNEFVNVSVVFKPTTAKQYIDSMIVRSNSKNNDSIARFNGIGTTSQLDFISKFPLGGFDWRRCYYLEPNEEEYKIDTAVFLKNSGGAPLRILNMYPRDVSPIKLGIPQPAQFLIQPGDSISFPSTFKPIAPGFYSTTIVVVTETDTLDFNIVGIGTDPQLLVDPYIQFGDVFISNNNDEKLRPITITNRNYEFMDTIHIESISFDGIQVGNYPAFSDLGFAVGETPQKIGPPITLYFVGSEFKNINGLSPTRAQVYSYFSPKEPGTVQAEVVINTKYKKKTIQVILEGTGVELSRDTFAILNYSGTRNMIACMGDSSTMTVNIINSGNATAQLNSLDFSVDMGEFTTNPVVSAANPLVISPNESRSVTVIWKALNTGSRTITMNATTNRTDDSSITASFTVGTTPNPNVSLKLNGGKSVEVGQNIVLSLDNENAFAWDEIMSNSLTVELMYDKTLLAPKVQLAVTPAFANLLTITHDPILSNATKDVYRITAQQAGTQIPVGTIATIDYSTYLPQRVLGEGEKNEGIDITPILNVIPETQNSCIFFVTSTTTVTLTPTCAFGLNSISGSGIVYSLSSMKPDPVTDFGGTIEFSVGLQTPVLLDVYNSLGEKVVTLVNQELQPGTYQVSFPATGFTSGMYTYKLSAGPYVASKPFILQK